MRLAQRVALVKHVGGHEPRDANREDEVRRRYEHRLAPAGWTPEAIDSWMRTLIEVSVHCQAQVPVAYQGAPGCWSHRTLRAQLPMARGVGYATFQDAWRAVERGDVSAAWLPVANSYLGPFHELDGLLSDAQTWYERVEPVRHVLVGQPGQDTARLVRVYGHPKALAQCRRRLTRIAPAATLVPVDDAGAHAREHPLGDTEAVLGCPDIEADGRVLLDQDVCDAPDNTTTFRLLAATAAL
jgi:prephenate dehydratase